ncbi:PA0069 family radical SAM protein [Methylophilus sp. TWE2]|uniref:PA0069 family radical SAM protein n=1 Tax=Methylophilus sp. TWE2 TaxID=1662285 RepID=UPI0006708ECE|nr:PA0069 family radical SAM protein [Methylophilus sp. TWE2]AKR43683.1 DNA repair photolyase [Methylophilus sp. TWE2]
MNEKPLIYKGRAASSNLVSRFDPHTRESLDDGWGSLDEEAPPLRTEVMLDASKSVINYIQSPDLPFDRTLNPYRGCEHGCIYCYARPTHAYLGMSPGLDFESRLLMKADAVALLKKELAHPKYQCKPIALGMNTDGYQPIEREYQLTRQIIQVLSEANHPFSLVTKSSLVERDIDLIAPMAAKRLTSIYVSITTLDRQVARRLEPRAAAPERRFETLRKLSEAGIPTGVMVAPVIPALTDCDMEQILEKAHAAGARKAGYVFLRLPHELSDLFEQWLQQYFPLKASHVMSIVKQSRGGKAYQSGFGQRMRGEGIFADLLAHRFKLSCHKLGMSGERTGFCTDLLSVPAAWQATANHPQLALF